MAEGSDCQSESSWTGALDPDAAGRVLAALDEPEPELEGIGDAALPLIQGYMIDGRIGGGGGGEVYRAVRIGSDRPLAIKLLNRHLGDTAESKRAWRELDVLEQLRLPAVPRLLDHGVYEGRLYLVTEYIDGCPLIEYCQSEELGREDLVELLAKVADAVQSLHEHGVIHRDVKPGNILVEERSGAEDQQRPIPRPFLVDLGIATLLSGDHAETLTTEGSPIGSPAYMSPEQARGEREAVSTRSDVYSLGATAYVILTGQTPHDMDATLHEAIRRVGQERPRSPRELEPSLPRPLAAILSKAVASRPEDRYASPAEFARDLRRWLHGEPVEAGEPTTARRMVGLMRRHPVLTTAAVCGLFIVATVAASYVSVWWINSRPHDVQIDPVNRSWVHLVSMSGRVLWEWDTGIVGGIRFAEVVDDEMGGEGRRLVLIGFEDRIDIADADGDFCAFDMDDPSEPLWRTGTGPPDIRMPEPISYVVGESFAFAAAMLDDIFPESPGAEIVTVHAHLPHSAYLIRVTATSGEVLYEVWHDGRVARPCWMPDPGLLVFCGTNSEATWKDRGIAADVGSRNPLIVFAVRPQLGQINREWIHTPGGKGRFEPVWYRCLLPPGNERFVNAASDHLRVVRPREYVAPSSHVRLDLTGGEPLRVSLALFLDENGQEVDRFVGDPFRIMPGLPGPDDFRIGELPPIVHPHSHFQAESEGG